MKKIQDTKIAKVPDEILKEATLCTMVIFGITGDLTKRLLFPAICNLGAKKLLDDKFHIIGIAHENYSTDQFRELLQKDVNEFVHDPAAKQYGLSLIKNVDYYTGDLEDPGVYTQLKEHLQQLEPIVGNKNALFYFAVPPDFISVIATGLSNAQLLSQGEGNNSYFRRLIVEKPFGHDLESAVVLNKQLLALVSDTQIFRIDHFLGKETVQNLLALRFSNGIFEPIWNRRYIDNVQITVSETLGVELRGAYYEHAGTLRDMVPNHLFQVLSLIAMEPPVSFSSKYIQDEKAKALRSVKILTPEEVFLTNGSRTIWCWYCRQC